MSGYPFTGVLAGLQFGLLIGLVVLGQRALRYWRLALRREAVLLAALQLYERELELAYQDDLDRERAAGSQFRICVAMLDELHAQEARRWWQGVPPLDEPWSTDEPAPIVTRLFEPPV